MKINEFITESFQTVSINGILYSLNTDEKTIYTKVKEAGKLLKKDLSEFDARVANGMVTKGVLKRRKNPQQEIYFVTKGRRKNAPEKPIDEVAPPDSQIEKWINDNKERFEEKYGKEYKKYLYGKAWNKFNGKKMVKESVERLDEHVLYDVHVYDIDWDIPSDSQDVKFNLDDYEDPNSDYVYDTIRDRIADEVGFYPASFSFEVNGVYDEDGNPYNADSEDDNGQDSENDLPTDYWDGDSEEEIIESIFQEAYMQLNEGVEDVKKYFPKISDDDFGKLLKLDPTYKGGDELGKYGKWILSLYNTFLKDKESYEKWEEQKKLGNNFPEPVRKSQEKLEDFEKLYNILTDFEVMNKKLRVNINNIKSIAELYKIVNDAKNEGISNNSKVNHVIDLVKKSVEKGGEVVFKDSNWVVLIPKTLKSSVVFGDDTNWCTTASNGKRYRYYKKEHGGEYYINVNLKDGSLYQFHFESDQFMDKNDHPIDILEFLNNNVSLFSFYKKHFGSSLVSKCSLGIIFVNNPSEEMQLKAIKNNSIALKYIDNPSEEVQLVAVKRYGPFIKYIDNPSEEVQLVAVKQNGLLINTIKNPSEEVKLTAVQQNGIAIQYIKNPSEELQLIAVKQDGRAIQYIKNPSEELQLIAVKDRNYYIMLIKNPSEEVQLVAVKQNAEAIQYIDNPSEEVQLLAVKQDAEAIQYIDNPSEELQLIAVTSDKKTLKLIKNPTPAVIKAAKKRKRKSTSSMNESAGSKYELDFYKRFEGTEVEAKDNGEVFTIVNVEHDGFGIRFNLESNETDRAIIVELDEMDKDFTGFVSFEKDDTENEDYWDGEDDEDELMETVHQAKFKKGQKLIHKSSGEEWTIRHIHHEHGLGFFYEIVRPLQLSNGEMATIKYNESEKSLEKDYENIDYPDDTENEDYWDGE